MRVLWITNFPLPDISSQIGAEAIVNEGWLIGMSNSIIDLYNIDLYICFPQKYSKNLVSGEIVDKYKYIGYYRKNPVLYDDDVEKQFCEIFENIRPDVIHIMGTEYPHSLAAVEASEKCGLIDKCVVSIQGFTSECARYYCNAIPHNIIKKKTIKDYFRKSNIFDQKLMFKKRGHYEKMVLNKAQNFIGRTKFDKAIVWKENETAKYYCNNESLRPIFYEKQWNIELCETHSIFMSLASYPIKGLHVMIEAMEIVKEKYPDCRLYIGGYNILGKHRLKYTYYDKYISNLIKEKELVDSIVFCGKLSEKEICDRFLKSNVFVLPSLIENSPNSLGEAMLLGIPCVAANVGGVSSMLKDGEEGFLYQSDASYMLAYYICKIFDDKEIALRMAVKARRRALETHNMKKNADALLDIYKDIKI